MSQSRSGEVHHRATLGTLWRGLVQLQRLLAPEPAALFRLLNRPPAWLSDADVADLRQSAEELAAGVSDSAALVERIRLLQEELGFANHSREPAMTIHLVRSRRRYIACLSSTLSNALWNAARTWDTIRQRSQQRPARRPVADGARRFRAASPVILLAHLASMRSILLAPPPAAAPDEMGGGFTPN